MLFKSSLFGFLTFTLSLLPICVTGQNHVKITTPQGSELWIYTPLGYPAAGSYPLLVSLLGGAEIGDGFNNILNITYANKGPSWLIANNQWPAGRPFIVITPKLERDPSIPNANNQVWDMNVLDEIIEHVCSQYQVDRNRVYLTGISLGAAACWNYAGTFPTKVAAIIPFAGNADRTLACQIKDIPVWVFHGTNDNFVRPDYFLPPNTVSSIGMVEAIKACNGFYTPQLNMLHAKAHEGWNQLYSETLGYDIYTWLLQFRKGEFVNSPPYVSAGRDLRVLNNSGPLYLSAFAFDVDSEIVEFFWEQISGPTLSTELVDSTFLKISNLITGTFNFRLTARDTQNEVTSKEIEIAVFDSLTTVSPSATGFILRNGSTKTDLRPLLKEDFINLYTEGLTSINIRAITSASTRSLRYIVNNDLDTRTTPNAPNPFYIYPFLGGTNEWIVPVGKYSICGIPFSGSGATGQIGIMYCSRLDVYDQEPLTYFAKSNSDISELSSWSLTPDGLGSAPASFQENFQTFIISTEVTVDNALPIKGVMTSLLVKNGGKLIINDSIAIPVSVESGGSVEVNTPHQVKWGSLDLESNVKFNDLANFIAGATYGNVEIAGMGSTKTLDASLVTVRGAFRVDDSIVLSGASNGSSSLRLQGNVDIGAIEFPDSENWFNVLLDGGNFQNISFGGSTFSVSQLTVESGTHANLIGEFIFLIASNEGLIVEDGGSLNLGSNTLTLTGGSSINPHQETGILKFTGGALIFDTQTENDSFLYFDENENELDALYIDVKGGGSISILDSLIISDSVSIKNGSIITNGKLILASTQENTAFIGSIEGDGVLIGDVQVQRIVESGRQYRYISVPVYNVTVENIQNYIPVTGSFDGANTGGSLSSNPSLFYYDESSDDWTAFPQVSHDEIFTLGTGYALFLRNETDPILLKLNGAVHQGPFVYSLGSNDDILNIDVGWNLIGNPYPAPINWGSSGWTKSGVSVAAYVRDNTVPGGRFLTWDGQTGDEEFGGRIALGQAFWVRSESQSPELVINESAKGNKGNQTFFRTAEDSNSITEILIVSLIKNNLIDRTYLKFNSSGSWVFDIKRDAVKKMNGYYNIFSLTEDSIAVAIKSWPEAICDMTWPLRINGLTNGYYQFVFQTENFDDLRLKNLHLKDNYLDSLISLEFLQSYSFSVSDDFESFKSDRFELVSLNLLAKPKISYSEGKLNSSYAEGNQWYFNGEMISGETDSSLVPVESGEYGLVVSYNNCSASAEVFHHIMTEVKSGMNSCKVFPNPSRGQVSIFCSEWSGHGVLIEIRDVLGVKLKSYPMFLGDEEIHISFADLAPGLYFLKLIKENEYTTIRLILE